MNRLTKSVRPTGKTTLSEAFIKGVLEALDWVKLKYQLDLIGLDHDQLGFLLGHLRRSSKMIMEYPNSSREDHRERFLGELKKYAHDALDRSAAEAVEQEIALIRDVEYGYRGILAGLEQCDISKRPAELRVAACISRTAHHYAYLIGEVQRVLKGRKDITLGSGPFLVGEDAVPISPDAVIAGLVDYATMTVQMEAQKNGWTDEQGRIVLPTLPAVTEDDRNQAGSVELLAICWQQWRRTEQRRRFLGGSFEKHLSPNLPQWVPQQTHEVTIYRPEETEIVDWIANERLNDRVVQTYMEMALRTNMERDAKGIEQPVAPLPEAFVSPQEAHGGVTLSEIMSYDVGSDQEKPGGLRFVEWLRGYAVLNQLAEEKWTDGKDPTLLAFMMSKDDLLHIVERCGMGRESADKFLDAVTFRKSSRDLFDCPLITLADGSFIVFGPALLHTNLARIILSNLGSRGESLSRKGKSFERDILSFLRGQNLKAASFQVSRDGEQYEYDVVFVWGNYVFVLECKSIGLSHHNPVQAYYFGLEMRSAREQIRRLVENLKSHPDILLDHFGEDMANKKIVPCVLNALPYSLPGPIDGVYFTDASALKRFFQERYLHINTPYQISDTAQLLYRAAVHSLWAGDGPTPEDLLAHLDNPIQFKNMIAHVETHLRAFALGRGHLAAAGSFVRKEMTVESFASVTGASAESLRIEGTEIARQVKRLKRRIQSPKPRRLTKKK